MWLYPGNGDPGDSLKELDKIGADIDNFVELKQQQFSLIIL